MKKSASPTDTISNGLARTAAAAATTSPVSGSIARLDWIGIDGRIREQGLPKKYSPPSPVPPTPSQPIIPSVKRLAAEGHLPPLIVPLSG